METPDYHLSQGASDFHLPHLEGRLLHLNSIGYFGGRKWVEKFVVVHSNVLVVCNSEEDYEKQQYSTLIDLLDVDVYATSILGSSKRFVVKLYGLILMKLRAPG